MQRVLVGCLVLFAGMVWGTCPAVGQKPAPKKAIKALLVTGGCCHDYERQKQILTKGISARANVEWTVVHQGGSSTNTKIPLYEDPNWAKGFDIVVHNECFAKVGDKEWVERILKPHREGIPAILIHCAMHCYRTGDDQWFEFVGVQSPRHGPKYSFTAENVKPDHPIMKDFGPKFVAPKGELYHTIKLFPSATPLAQANRQSDGEPQTCVWTNQYGKARVFCTTIGHYNETMAEPAYLDFVTRGLLWAVGRDTQKDFKPSTQQIDEQIKSLINAPVGNKQSASDLPVACCGQGNLVAGRPAKASSEQTSNKNYIKNAVDGNLRTRWCASNASAPQTWQVELAEKTHVRNVRIHWEQQRVAYRYKVESSADGETWKTIVDQSKNSERQRITPHEVDAPDTKHLRVTFLGTKKGAWGSFWEFEAYAGDLPELPETLAQEEQEAPATVSDVQIVPGFDVKMFGTPPEVNYPVCLTAAPTGEVFVGVDEQGSLGKEAGRGKILRLIDRDGDGRADVINEFAKIDHPRGLVYDQGTLWVLHPPFLTVLHDDDRDGKSDRQKTLVTGISTDQVNKRGADHTTNGIRMGIDGWIYIAVGDFGFVGAKGTDGTTLSRRGGGIVRVRPDGTEMEIFCWGLRNILDVSIDPYLNIFTRDNTNDGGGWDIRVSHILQSANYGYPSLYKNFTEEIMPPLADYGGGSGCGTMYLHDKRWPAEFGDALYTCDWGRSEVYRHKLPETPPTFAPHQEVFAKIPRPTDIDVDGSGRMYVSSWKNGKFNFSGPDVGFIAQIVPQNFLPKPFPNLSSATATQLVEHLQSPSAVHRLHSQREILRRGQVAGMSELLSELAKDATTKTYARVAAIFTLKQLDGVDSHEALLNLAKDESVREFALKALTDRKPELEGIPTEPFIEALNNENPRVRAQAVISLGRLGWVEAAEHLLPLTVRSQEWPAPTTAPLWNQPDRGRVIPHLAVQALVQLNAVESCLKALDGPYRSGALWALRSLHSPKAVDGLFQALSKSYRPAERLEILTGLMRLYHQEGDYKTGWWGTRPDTTGPYYDRQTWSESDRIAQAIEVAFKDANKPMAEKIAAQVRRHHVKIEGLNDLVADNRPNEPEKPIEIPKVDPANPNLIANLAYDVVMKRALAHEGDAKTGSDLFKRQACVNCHTYINGQSPKGPHLVDIGKRYKKTELVESILKPSEKIAQGFDTYSFVTSDGQIITGFVVSESAETLTLREANGLSKEVPQQDIEERVKRKLSMMPEGIAKNLTPEELADLIAFLQSLK